LTVGSNTLEAVFQFSYFCSQPLRMSGSADGDDLRDFFHQFTDAMCRQREPLRIEAIPQRIVRSQVHSGDPLATPEQRLVQSETVSA